MPRKVLVILFLALAMLASCAASVTESVPSSAAIAPTPTAGPDVSKIVANAVELDDESYYFAELWFQKYNRLNPIENWTENYAKTVVKTIMIGKYTYDSWPDNGYISIQPDKWAWLTKGLWVEYTVKVVQKWTAHRHYWVDRRGIEHGMSWEEFDAAIEKLSGDKLLRVPYTGKTIYYVLDKPLSQYKFVSWKPMQRYFIEVKIKNDTQLDLLKQLRNSSSEHLLQFEVPKATYDRVVTNELWQPEMYLKNVLLSGHLSKLHGYVTKRWTLPDPRFVEAMTDSGKVMVVPKNIVGQ